MKTVLYARVSSDRQDVDLSISAQLEVLDEFYSANLAQEVTSGMRESAARGFWVSSHSPYGYRRIKVQDGAKWRAKLEPDPETSEVVRVMFRMVGSGAGCKETACKLNADGIPSSKGKLCGKGRVHAVLTNEVYTGAAVWGKGGDYHRGSGLEPVRVEGAFPALVDRATYDGVQRRLRSRAPKATPPARVSRPYLLSGILHCGKCRAAMFGHAAKSGQYHYYVCATAHRNGRNICGAKAGPQTRRRRAGLGEGPGGHLAGGPSGELSGDYGIHSATT